MHYLYSEKINILADPDKVWGELIATDRYHEWNEFTPKVDLKWEKNAPVKMEVLLDGPEGGITRQTEYLKSFEPYKLSWGMSWWVLKALRVQQLTPTDSGCEYFTSDSLSGPISPIVHWLYGSKIQEGLSRVARCLKKRCESS